VVFILKDISLHCKTLELVDIFNEHSRIEFESLERGHAHLSKTIIEMCFMKNLCIKTREMCLSEFQTA
jgi:hypothetical protein